jgi:hypothetical protein
MYLHNLRNFGSLSLLFIGLSLYATPEQDKNITYIELPKVPSVNVKPVIPQKAVKVAPLITVNPKGKKRTITQKEYIEYQKLKKLKK